jgi:hemolysin D
MITSNGNGSNGKGNIKLDPLDNTKDLKPGEVEAGGSGFNALPPRASSLSSFDAPIILTQSSSWSHWILWLLMALATGGIVWACIAKIEEAIPATGKLEPTGTVKEVQSPVNGVVKAIYVDDGQKVKKGEVLLRLDPTAAKAQNASLQQIRTSLLQENQFYTTAIHGGSLSREATELKLPLELVSLTKSRANLVAENQLYKALSGGGDASKLNVSQLERWQSSRAELSSRVNAARLEGDQLTKQLEQTDIKLANTKQTLELNQGILTNILPLAEAGAISKIQLLKQQQEVQTATAEADGLVSEQARLKLAISQAKSQTQNATDLSRQQWLNQIGTNEQSIAEIDSQLTKAMVENNKRLSEIDSQISTAQLQLRYEQITAPSDGTIFDLQAHNPGFVANASQPILKIVPNDAMTAKVFITNRDIGFVKQGMDVDVRIDSFPFSEFGDVKGKLMWIGDDALPPDQIYPFYRFPAKVKLQNQFLLINGRKVPLQSGMSVNANIKVRSRTVMSIFTDLFSKSVESLKTVR